MAELFGSIASAKASIRIVKGGDKVMIIRCSLAETDHTLAAIALCDLPATTLDMSSSVKRLKRRL
jgi:RNase P/RNase MRP subunit POP5